ncbi:hypothetical protein NYQ10_02310 [Flavobacterium johnsoniae]|uniref:hypothetical protein n=1 Tax=Flavobacterium johnsoniae TaxID=986 RepID=UPI0025AFCE6A|nr:hypothetical protein [Flavobacterium johnsoniae]WJS95293.1 hypothetical protein NYQ10_02310 [Flavobacterium johnsoniae]
MRKRQQTGKTQPNGENPYGNPKTSKRKEAVISKLKNNLRKGEKKASKSIV